MHNDLLTPEPPLGQPPIFGLGGPVPKEHLCFLKDDHLSRRTCLMLAFLLDNSGRPALATLH